MSTIRFIHTDFLRLACSMQGVNSAPGWLQEAMTDATRRATRQVIETAVNQRSDFLLIGGRPSDDPEDLEIACGWLDEQLAVARRQGIQVIAVADNDSEFQTLARICDVVVNRRDHLLVNRTATGPIQLSTSATIAQGHNDLVVSFGNHPQAAHSSCHYLAVSQSDSGCSDSCGHVERISVSAGAIQAAKPTEQWQGACQSVEVDTVARRVRSNAVGVSSIRYVTQQVDISGRTTVSRLLEEIALASRGIARGISETVLVDWVVSASVDCSACNADQLEESNLLKALRTDLQSGHQGVWPRSVRFSSDSKLHGLETMSEAARLLEMVGTAGHQMETDGRNAHSISPELICGLAALQEAA